MEIDDLRLSSQTTLEGLTMNALIKVLIGIIAIMHGGFLVLEMFLWSTPAVQSKFQTFTPEEMAAILAGNQGLYNGFLAAGLLWGLLDREKCVSIWVFCLSCIAIAGVYGSFSLGRPTALLIQTMPAVIGLLFLITSKRDSAQAIESHE